MIIKKFLSFSIGTWLGAVIGLITIPIITHFISAEDLGKATMFTLAINILTIAAFFGTDQTFVRFYYETKTGGLLYKCLIINSFVGLILSVLLWIFRVQISIYLFGTYISWTIYLLIFSTILSIVNNYASQILRMDQKGFLYSFIQVGLRLFELLFILLLFLFLENDFKVVVYAKVITLFSITLLSIYTSWTVWSSLRQFVRRTVYPSLRDIFLYSYPLALTTLISWALVSFDKIAIKEWSTLKELGIYSAAFRIVLVLQIVQASFTTYWLPLSYERFLKHNNDEENRIFFSKASRLVTVIMFFCGIGLIMTKDLFTIILGPEFREAVNMIPFLILWPVMYTISESTVIGINFFKKVKVVMLIAVITLITNAIGNYYLVLFFDGIGAAMATGFSSVLYFTLRTAFSLKYYKVDYKLKRLYFALFLILCYALFSTFYKWNIYNLMAGLALLITVGLIYSRDIQLLLKHIFSK